MNTSKEAGLYFWLETIYGGGANGLEGAAIISWRVGLHVPGVDVRGTAAKEKQDC